MIGLRERWLASLIGALSPVPIPLLAFAVAALGAFDGFGAWSFWTFIAAPLIGLFLRWNPTKLKSVKTPALAAAAAQAVGVLLGPSWSPLVVTIVEGWSTLHEAAETGSPGILLAAIVWVAFMVAHAIQRRTKGNQS